MNIGIDIDDTITDTFDYLMPYVAEYYNLDIEYLKENNISYNTLPKGYNERDFGKSIYHKILKNIPPKKDVAKYIKKLKNDGNKIIIITARDREIYDNPNEITKNQLEKLGIEYDKLICTLDKRLACLDENIDLFIEDTIDNLRQVQDVVKYPCLFKSKANSQEEVPFIKVNNWKEVYDYYLSIKKTKRRN